MELQSDRAKKEKSLKLPPSKIYFANFESVWRAALTSLRYSITEQNQETGYIETDFIKPGDGSWIRPDEKTQASPGFRYRISLSFVRIKTDNGRNGVRVTAEKKIERLRDFFSDPETIESDFLEEKTILYRIDRELLIEDALKKTNTNEAPPI